MQLIKNEKNIFYGFTYVSGIFLLFNFLTAVGVQMHFKKHFIELPESVEM